MRSFLLSLSGKLQAFFIIGATLIIAFTSAILFSLCFDEHQLVVNTDLISSVYQVMGTVYAILLTFTLWGVWQNFTEAKASVQNDVQEIVDWPFITIFVTLPVPEAPLPTLTRP